MHAHYHSVLYVSHTKTLGPIRQRVSKSYCIGFGLYYSASVDIFGNYLALTTAHVVMLLWYPNNYEIDLIHENPKMAPLLFLSKVKDHS